MIQVQIGPRGQRTRTFPQTLSTRTRQANAPEPDLPTVYERLRSMRKVRPANWPVFPVERSNSLRLPSNFLRPSTPPRQSQPHRSERRSETRAILFVRIF